MDAKTDKKKPEAELKLKVAEAIQDDVNKGIVRIDNSFMQHIIPKTKFIFYIND